MNIEFFGIKWRDNLESDKFENNPLNIYYLGVIQLVGIIRWRKQGFSIFEENCLKTKIEIIIKFEDELYSSLCLISACGDIKGCQFVSSHNLYNQSHLSLQKNVRQKELVLYSDEQKHS